jgi:hypothetical protein
VQGAQSNPGWQTSLLVQTLAATRGVKVQPVVGSVDTDTGVRVALWKGRGFAA